MYFRLSGYRSIAVLHYGCYYYMIVNLQLHGYRIAAGQTVVP